MAMAFTVALGLTIASYMALSLTMSLVVDRHRVPKALRTAIVESLTIGIVMPNLIEALTVARIPNLLKARGSRLIDTGRLAGKMAWKAGKGQAKLARQAMSSREPKGARLLKYGLFALAGSPRSKSVRRAR